jgi:hypothetical protein
MNFISSEPRNKREERVAHFARSKEQKRIIEMLMDRYLDLNSCTKDDGCKELARIVEVCMEDINHDQ